MKPVIGLDVSKGSSVFQAFLRRNESYGKPENITHDERGFMRLGELVGELREHTGIEPFVILEATGHYHRGIVAFFTREEMRKVKTDAVDAWNLVEMYYRGDVKPHRTWTESYTELQHATRQHEFVTTLYVKMKIYDCLVALKVQPGNFYFIAC